MTGANWAEVAAITVPTLTILGGLSHVVYRLGRLTEKVEGLENDVGRVLSHVWPVREQSAEGRRRSGAR